MTDASFEQYYRTALDELGLDLGDDDALEEGLPTNAPAALRAWYLVAGGSWLNSAHNRILGPDELRDAGDKVIFAEENQDAVVWGFHASTVMDDPDVWQGQAIDDRVEWYSEEMPLSRFLMEMLRHTVAQERPSP